MATYLEPSLGGEPLGSRYALGLISLLLPTGFLAGYIRTREFIAEAFARAERRLGEVATMGALAEEADGTTSELARQSGLSDEPVPTPTLTTSATTDPTGAIAQAHQEVVSTILNTHELVYGERESDVSAAVRRLAAGGFLDDKLLTLAGLVLGLTINPGQLPLDQVTSILDSTQKFLRSCGRAFSLAFEAKVEEALRAIPNIHVERRPHGHEFKGRAPDFLVQLGDGKRVVVEAYFPSRALSRGTLNRRVRERLPFIDLTQARALLVVVPDGAATGVEPGDPRVTVATLTQLQTDSLEALVA